MNIDEENKAREFYIKSTIKGTHTPPNMVELNYLDLLKLMHSYAQEQIKNLGLFSVSSSLPSDEEFETALEKEAFRVPYDGSNNYYDEPTLKHWCKCWEWVKNAVSNSALAKAETKEEQLTIPVVSNWVACDELLPEHLQTVWLANKEKQWVCLGCLVDTNEGWHWAESNGVIYVDEGKIVSECESDDLDVTHWCALPDPPCC
jgi:hypothetical protein